MIQFLKTLWYAFVQAWKKQRELPEPPRSNVPDSVRLEYERLRMSPQWSRFGPVMPQNAEEYYAVKKAENGGSYL